MGAKTALEQRWLKNRNQKAKALRRAGLDRLRRQTLTLPLRSFLTPRYF
jgi:hypothetical protein